MEQLCFGLGSNGTESFGDDLHAVAGMVVECHFSLIETFTWTDHGSLLTHAFDGDPDAISLYWGDENHEFVRTLDADERACIESVVRREQKDNGVESWG